MNISTMPQFNMKSSAFKGYSEYRTPSGSYNYYTTTRFFREDLSWTDFVYMLKHKYKNVPKVNVICHACSDGEEPFSLALKLDTTLKNDAQKFYPIIAKDFDSLNILYGKKGKYEVTPVELYKMENECGLKLYDYLKTERTFNNQIYLSVKDKLKEKVYFQKADLTQDVKNIPSSNTVLLTRNVWPYIPSKKQKILAEELANKLDDTSLLVIGNFDISQHINNILEDVGFEMTELYGVMKKKTKELIQDEFYDARTLLNKIKVQKSMHKVASLV